MGQQISYRMELYKDEALGLRVGLCRIDEQAGMGAKEPLIIEETAMALYRKVLDCTADGEAWHSLFTLVLDRDQAEAMKLGLENAIAWLPELQAPEAEKTFLQQRYRMKLRQLALAVALLD